MKRRQPQFESDEERFSRARREAEKETMVVIAFLFLGIPAILLLIGWIAYNGQQNLW